MAKKKVAQDETAFSPRRRQAIGLLQLHIETSRRTLARLTNPTIGNDAATAACARVERLMSEVLREVEFEFVDWIIAAAQGNTREGRLLALQTFRERWPHETSRVADGPFLDAADAWSRNWKGKWEAIADAVNASGISGRGRGARRNPESLRTDYARHAKRDRITRSIVNGC